MIIIGIEFKRYRFLKKDNKHFFSITTIIKMYYSISVDTDKKKKNRIFSV